jgi:chromosome segregation ATPase
MNIIEILVPLFIFIIGYPIISEVIRMSRLPRLIESFRMNKNMTKKIEKKIKKIKKKEKNQKKQKKQEPMTSSNKELIEDTTKSKLLSEENSENIKELESAMNTFGQKNEARFAALESVVGSNNEDKTNIESVNNDLDKIKKGMKESKNNIISIETELSGKPTTGYVNSRVGGIEDKMKELEMNYRKLRTEFQSFSS